MILQHENHRSVFERVAIKDDGADGGGADGPAVEAGQQGGEEAARQEGQDGDGSPDREEEAMCQGPYIDDLRVIAEASHLVGEVGAGAGCW